MRAQTAWVLALVAGQTGDVLTTWFGLRSGIPEGNPIVRAALASGDFVLFGTVKAALVAAIVLLAFRVRRQWTWRGLQLVAVMFLAVSVLNGAGLVTRLA